MSRPACICEFGTECNGLGTLQCDGCGGDLCVCRCGGEIPCPGCMWCLQPDEAFDLVEDPSPDPATHPWMKSPDPAKGGRAPKHCSACGQLGHSRRTCGRTTR